MGRHHAMRDADAAECVLARHRAVEREVVMPQWVVPDTENPGKFRQAVLDVFSRPPPRFEPLCQDTHCFHPWTAAGEPSSKTFADAEKEKHERYPGSTIDGRRLEAQLLAVVYSTYGSIGPEAESAFLRMANEGRFGRRFIARLALVVVKAAARQVLAALGRACETFGLADYGLPPPPLGVPRPGAAPHPWQAAARAHGAARSRILAESQAVATVVDETQATLVDSVDSAQATQEQNATQATAAQSSTQATAATEPREAPSTTKKCSMCKEDRPVRAFDPNHWAGKNKGHGKERKCMRCAPRTAGYDRRYCVQCDRAKPKGEFGPDVKYGKSGTCRTCSTQHARLSFYVNGTPDS